MPWGITCFDRMSDEQKDTGISETGTCSKWEVASKIVTAKNVICD